MATWNLEWLHHRNGRGPVPRGDADYARLRAHAERLAADIVAVQEVEDEAALARVFEPSRYAFHLVSQRSPQRAGFAYRRGLSVVHHPDLDGLDVGGLRAAADLAVATAEGQVLRLLSVHLKSDCFAGPATRRTPACVKLWAQLPVLEAWVDARAAHGEPFAVLGDFNRRLGAPRDPFFAELDDGEPPNADLVLAGAGRASRCWGGAHPEPVDHIVLSKNAAPWLVPGSFVEHVYPEQAARFRATLSDHCPVSVLLLGGATHAPPSDTLATDSSADAEQGAGWIKGNINARGDKLYHLPGCPSYASTRIDESRGERLFASEVEARAAGWVRAPGCR